MKCSGCKQDTGIQKEINGEGYCMDCINGLIITVPTTIKDKEVKDVNKK